MSFCIRSFSFRISSFLRSRSLLAWYVRTAFLTWRAICFWSKRSLYNLASLDDVITMEVLEFTSMGDDGLKEVGVLLATAPLLFHLLLLLEFLRDARFPKRLSLCSPICIRVQRRLESRVALQRAHNFASNLKHRI